MKQRSSIIRTVLFAATLASVTSTNAENSPFETNLRLTLFGDVAASGDATSDAVQGSGRVDAYLTYRSLWKGATLNAQVEAAGGDRIYDLGSGVVWPTNVYAAVPRETGDDNVELSLTLTQEVTPAQRMTFGKFNVVDLASRTPLAGGNGSGGFLYTGIAAPPSFVFPPYVFGMQFAGSTDSFSYALFGYDPNNAQGESFWSNLFDDGVVLNGTVTYPTELSGLPGFYGANLIHSTAKGTDFDSLLLPPDADDFARQTRGISYAALKFQQYLSYDPDRPNEGWGVFGQIGFGDGNPHQLDNSFILGLAGTSPLPGRGTDRWGLAWARYNWSNSLVSALEAQGSGLRDEWAVETFYEAAITKRFRLGINAMHIRPGGPGFNDYVQIGLRARLTL